MQRQVYHNSKFLSSISSSPPSMARIISIIFFSFLLAYSANAKLRSNFYATTCPRLHTIVFNVMRNSVRQEPRLGASILRLFFHDCFVNGCDGSILLDDTPTFTGEKNSRANKNSARGFEVIDRIKTEVEAACKATVSCADILALAARDGTTLLGGPRWVVKLGRRDSRTASQSDADSDLPSPFDDLSSLVISFLNKGLSARDMVALSGSHTIGLAHCRSFRSHIYNDTNIDPRFAALRHSTCPRDPNAGGSNLAPLDSLTPTRFGSHYYKNLVHRRGLLHSDQELFNGGSLDELVRIYSINHRIFFLDFAAAMVRMGNLSPLTGTNGEIRRNCRVIN